MERIALGLSACREPRIQGHAAIDEERRSRHIIRLIGSQPNSCFCDVLRHSDTVIWNERAQRRLRSRRLPGHSIDGRLDCPWSNRVDANLMWRQLLCDALHEELDTTLRCRVVAVPSPWNHLMNRAHADDLSRCHRSRGIRATPQELACRFSCTKELSGEVDIQYELPICEAHLREGRIALQTG